MAEKQGWASYSDAPEIYRQAQREVGRAFGALDFDGAFDRSFHALAEHERKRADRASARDALTDRRARRFDGTGPALAGREGGASAAFVTDPAAARPTRPAASPPHASAADSRRSAPRPDAQSGVPRPLSSLPRADTAPPQHDQPQKKGAISAFAIMAAAMTAGMASIEYANDSLLGVGVCAAALAIQLYLLVKRLSGASWLAGIVLILIPFLTTMVPFVSIGDTVAAFESLDLQHASIEDLVAQLEAALL
ncbi:hypothetical protein HLV38_00820 [Berryella wangjianweii]|uniref:Uncharacterized protein n=1 Tax=Berryella wangjianweii TaxID=2734634 RepID=A0A6M8IZQ6_9ACTN|nr:hypothetical protein [Berryella wangjianweii]NPD32412.1 hypothetical protein [Eggerthellaceae bacterium zg-997]QKF06824.1 hypothetical protein HLV38_00820 [Berryella wangjianweii]